MEGEGEVQDYDCTDGEPQRFTGCWEEVDEYREGLFKKKKKILGCEAGKENDL